MPHRRFRPVSPHCTWLLSLALMACVAEQERAPGEPDPWADRVVSFTPGPFSGFGQDRLPEIVLGEPHGGGDGAGSLDVLTLGKAGEVILAFDDLTPIDGPGPDLLVFENPFATWLETGEVAASEDGETWYTWPCDPEDAAGGFPGCAGVRPVQAHPGSDISALDPKTAGGDAFDLAYLGLKKARYLRIRDTGLNVYEGQTGGFDLDAVAVVHGELVDASM